MPLKPNSTLKIAHRGASGYAPENTWLAFVKAIELSADMIELDVRQTLDGELVVFHDSRLKRLMNVKGRIKKITYHQLRRYNINGESIPRLVEILELIRGRCQINIEIKQRGMEHKLSDLIKRLNLVNDVLFSSFLHSELAKIKAIDQNFRIAILINSKLISTKAVIKLAKQLQAEAINVPYNIFNLNLLKAIKKQGLKVNVWTIDNYDDIYWLRQVGVDGIVSNFPDRL